MMNMRAELQSILDSLRQMPVENVPELLGELEVIRASALMRLSVPSSTARTQDELLEISVAAGRLGVSTDYLYRNSKALPFTRRMGRSLKFSSLGIDEYIRKTRGR